jgi:hypothetical protein
MPYVKQVNVNSHNFGAFLINKTLFGFDKDVLYIYCYVQPEGSPYYAYFDVENGIVLLEDYLTDCLLTYGDVYVFLCGDLNSRTSNVSHHCQEHNSNYFLDSQFVSHPASVDRCSEDNVLNAYGKLLLDMCTALDLRILNGVCHGDLHGCYTYVSDRGSSVNDYFVMSCELFSFLCESCELNISERIESDHMPVQFCFNSLDDCQENVVKENIILEKFVWNEDCTDVYSNNICSTEFQERMALAVNLIDVDINEALQTFNMCIKDAAECMKKQIRCTKKYKSQDWFDIECKISRRQVRNLLGKFRRTLDNNDRDSFCKARREYKQLQKQKRKEFNNALLAELIASITSQKQFWDTVHKISSKKKTTNE